MMKGLRQEWTPGSSWSSLRRSLPLSGRPPSEESAEAGFVRDMIVHHSQAVEMAEIVRDRTDSDAIRLLATDIALGQQAQIGIMRGWRLPVLYDLATTSVEVGYLSQHASTLRCPYPAPR